MRQNGQGTQNATTHETDQSGLPSFQGGRAQQDGLHSSGIYYGAVGGHIHKTIAAKHIRKIPQVDNGLVARQNEQEHTKGSKGIAPSVL